MNRLRTMVFCIFSILLLAGVLIPASGVNAAPAITDSHSVFLPMITGGTNTTTLSLPSLNQFIGAIGSGLPGEIKGVYVDGEFALQVIQQPDDNYNYVSTKPEVVTQYGLAAKMGVVGLLAHNNLAGRNFFLLDAGELVTLVYGDGSTLAIRVIALDRYQALDPDNAYSQLMNLADGNILDSTQAFKKYYTQENTIVFQTCISQDGNSSWGRLFVVAEPVNI